ncbi:MAG: cytochrome b/b6 domain-containing protein [Desulfobacterales bacterium]|jgi:cytochrome b subunit of formate dehydrogenase
MVNNELALDAETGVPSEAVADERYFVRLNKSERVQHMIFAACFFVLVATGFMLKLPESFLSFFGQAGEMLFRYRRLLHRTAGTLMILVSVYHVYYLLLKPAGRRWLVDMLPRLKDLKDMRDNLLYYFNIRNEPPEFDRFCYKHKIEYGALIAGTTIMSVTGIILWTQYEWSKFVVDIAALVHGMEAILASLAIMIWHFYEIHFRPHKSPLDNLWITGVINEAEMKEEYMLHYKKIMNDPELQKIFIKENPKRGPES